MSYCSLEVFPPLTWLLWNGCMPPRKWCWQDRQEFCLSCFYRLECWERTFPHPASHHRQQQLASHISSPSVLLSPLHKDIWGTVLISSWWDFGMLPPFITFFLPGRASPGGGLSFCQEEPHQGMVCLGKRYIECGAHSDPIFTCLQKYKTYFSGYFHFTTVLSTPVTCQMTMPYSAGCHHEGNKEIENMIWL